MEIIVPNYIQKLADEWKTASFEGKLEIEKRWEAMGYTMYELMCLLESLLKRRMAEALRYESEEDGLHQLKPM